MMHARDGKIGIRFACWGVYRAVGQRLRAVYMGENPMAGVFQVAKDDRLLEVRALLSGGEYQIWILESGKKIYLYEIVPSEGSGNDRAAVQRVIGRAKADIETDAIIVPIVRNWPEIHGLSRQ